MNHHPARFLLGALSACAVLGVGAAAPAMAPPVLAAPTPPKPPLPAPGKVVLPTPPMPKLVDLSKVPPHVLVLDSFSAVQTTCTPAPHHVKVMVTAVVRLQPMQAGPKPMVDVKLNGVSQGAQIVLADRLPGSTQTYLHVRREIEIPNAGGRATIQLTLNGAASSSIQAFDYACFRPAAPTVATGINRPDIAVGSPQQVVVMYEPPVYHEPCHPQGLIQCGVQPPDYPRYFNEIDPGTGFITNDFTAPVPVYRMTGYRCTSTDAFVTVTFHLPFTTRGLSSPPPPDDVAFDFRVTTPTPRAGYSAFPTGFYWLRVEQVLPCTRRGTFTYTFDQNNVVNESDETNNTIRFEYATMAP